MKGKYILILSISLSCTAEKDLEVKDLKFPNFERDAIAANTVDTTYLLVKNPNMKLKLGPLLAFSDLKMLTNWKFAVVGFTAYDSLGCLVSDQTDRWEINTYQYDSNGILNYRIFPDCVTQQYVSTYEFFPDSLVLYQHWKNEGLRPQISDGASISVRLNYEGKAMECTQYRLKGISSASVGGDRLIRFINRKAPENFKLY